MRIRPIHVWFLVAIVWSYIGTTAYQLYKPTQDLNNRIKATRSVS